MLPYFALAAVVIALAVSGEAVHRAYAVRKPVQPPQRLHNSYFDLLAVAVLVGFSGFRYYVGTDYSTYYSIYDSVDTDDWSLTIESSPQESGYTILMLMVKSISESPYAIFWVSAALTVIPIYMVVKRHSAFPALSVALYLFLFFASSFNGVRQWIAAALLFLAWSYYRNRRALALTLLLLAASFHVSALFAAVLLLVGRRLRLSWGTAAIVLIGAVALAGIVDRVPAIAQFAASFNPRYANYFASGETGIGAYLHILAYACLLLFSIYIGTRDNPLVDSDRRLAVYVLIGIGMMLAGTQALVLFRMEAYFALFLLLLVPNRVAVMKERVAATMLVLVGSGLYFVMYLRNFGGVTPYETYFTW